MRRLLIFSVAAFAAATQGAVIEDIRVPSPSMGKDIPACVVLPDKYAADPGMAFSTVYVVHGAGGNYRTYATEELKFLADRHEFLFVCADGGKTSWWFDSPIDPSYRYETHVTKELVPWIDAHYRVIRDRAHRAIMGGSMGGHGACWLGFRHKELFGAIGSIYGGMNLWNFPNSWDIAKRLGPRDEFPERWREHSVVTEAMKLKNGDVNLIMAVGTSDFFLSANRELHNILTSNKVAHTYIEIRTAEEKTSGHSGEFNAMVKPIITAFFDNYFKNGEAQIATAVTPFVTRYASKVTKAAHGTTPAPEIKVPAPWRVVEGDEAKTGLNVREYYFTIEAPGRGLAAPRVELVWPGVAVKTVYGAKNMVRDGDRVLFTPTATKPPTGFTTGWSEGAIRICVFHNVEGVQHGLYRDRPYPAAEVRAQNNWLFAARELFRRAGLAETNATEGAFVQLFGFESNFPNGHVDAPPHFHVMLMWNAWKENNVGHYRLDGKGRITENAFLVCGNVPGYPRTGYFPQQLGETTHYNAPSGKTLFTLEMLRDGTGLVFRRPGVPGEYLLGSPEPVSSVCVSFREDGTRPWRELARVSADDDSREGVLTIRTTVDGQCSVETVRYNPDTGERIKP